jgi:DUF971 family protein
MSEAPRRGPAVEPREIMQESDAALRVTWADGRACQYSAARLRRLCPCAQCVNEFTGERVLKAETIPEDLRIEDVEIVGRYALTFRWSDGHDTGIYSFRYLREICEEA